MSKILFDGLSTLAQLDKRFEEILQSNQWKELKEYAEERREISGGDVETKARAGSTVSRLVG